MIDHGDRYRRTVCDVCERPFNPKRPIPIDAICRDCRSSTPIKPALPIELAPPPV